MKLTYDLLPDAGPKIGLIVLQSDESIEADMARLMPESAELMVSRVPSGSTVTPESLQTMALALTGSAQLLPRDMDFAAVGYGCTSGTAQIGVDVIADKVKSGVRTSEVTQPVSGLIAACRALKVKRLAIISPYIATVSERLCTVLAVSGVTVSALRSFEEPLERNVARIAPASLRAAGIAIGQDTDCDAVFLSCTNLRTLDIIEDIENETGKPVLSSNQVLGWHLTKLAGMTTAGLGPGTLYR